MLILVFYIGLLAVAWLLPHIIGRRPPPRTQPYRQLPVVQRRTVSSPKSTKSTQPRHYPQTPEDISRAVRYIQKATTSNIPAELLKHILFYADYDCIHFRAHSDTTITRRSGDQVGKSYIETEPLQYLSSSSRSLKRAGRIRALHVEVTGRDQGWGGDSSGSWSWFEIERKRQTKSENSMKLAHNAVASKIWQHHEMDIESNEQLRTWASALRNGDRVCLVPMALYPGWSCSASSGSIDVEVEVWR